MLNPGLPADKQALIRSSLEAGFSPAKVAKLMNIPYSIIYIYYKNFYNNTTNTKKFKNIKSNIC